METYNITLKDLKNAINKIGYTNHKDVWDLLDIILKQKRNSLENLKHEFIAIGGRTRSQLNRFLNVKLKQTIDGFLTLHGLKSYVGEWHIGELFKGNIKNPDVERKIKFYNDIFTELEKEKKEYKMLMDFTEDYEDFY
jgi:hypothetical protein